MSVWNVYLTVEFNVAGPEDVAEVVRFAAESVKEEILTLTGDVSEVRVCKRHPDNTEYAPTIHTDEFLELVDEGGDAE
jgi:hypothetical protein